MGRIGFGRNVELDVICVTLEIDIIFTEYLTKRKYVNDE